MRRAESRRPSAARISSSRASCSRTALAPGIGYDRAAEIAKEAYKTGRTIREVAREKTDLSEDELDQLLDARKMTGP